MNDQVDYSAYADHANAASPAASITLKELSNLVDQQAIAEAEVIARETALDEAKSALKELSERRIPEAMEALGLETVKTRSGVSVSIKEDVRASISKARQFEAFAWLRENGAGSLIKRKVQLEFGRGEDDQANELKQQLESEGFTVEDNTSVHASMLTSYVKAQLAEGVDIPQELLGVFRQRKSVIKTK